MRRHKLAGAGITLAAAAAAGSLIVGGVGSAATTSYRSGVKAMARSALPPQASHAAIKASLVSASPTTTKMYLRVAGVTGEVTDVGYLGAIAAYSYSWGVSNPPGGKAQVSTLNLFTGFDRAEPPLEKDSETGATISTVTLTDVAGDGSKIRTVVLTNAHIDSLQISGPTGDSPSVSLTFSYEQRRITYYYKDSGGMSHSVTSCWNVAAQSTC